MNLKEAYEFARKVALRDYTPEEYSIFMDLLGALDHTEAEALLEAVQAELDKHPSDESYTNPGFEERMSATIREYAAEMPVTGIVSGRVRGSVIPLWTKWVAACVLVGLVTTIYVIIVRKDNAKTAVRTAFVQSSGDTGIAPGHAYLLHPDGSKTVLDNAAQGILFREEDGVLVTPKGIRFQVLLADGTRVWLNAEASLKLLSAGAAKRISVALTGEAYFEVMHHADAPFRVHFHESTLTDIGTKFDIMAYDNEKTITGTVLEGAVSVYSDHFEPKQLRQGQQIQITGDGSGTRVVDSVDVNAVVSWTKGYFYVKGADLGTVMRQIARWYDRSVQYAPGLVPEDHQFSGNLSQTTPLDSLLKILERPGLHFKDSAGTILVKP